MKNLTLFVIIISVIASSCTVYQHIPTPQNLPALNEKNQFQVNVNADFRKGSLQMNYAVSNAMLIFAEGFFYKSQNSGWFDKITSEDQDSYNGWIGEFKSGFGFYHREENTGFSLLLGGGTGAFEYEHSILDNFSTTYNYKVNGRNFDIFVQPAISFQPVSYFELIISARYKHYVYYGINQFHRNDESHLGESYDYLFYRPFTHYNFIEPAFTMRVGSENVKFQLQLFRSFCFDKNPPMYKEVSLNYQLGTIFTFGGNPKAQPADL
ncbi:MAG: hypothetical protein HC905_25805 [Bacteroidales bacterium]|nr:hypothetical protein [Bacteroidales bacterium]